MIVFLAIATGVLASLGYLSLLALLKALPIIPNQLIVFSAVLSEYIECFLTVALVVGTVALFARRAFKIQTWRPAIAAACGAATAHAYAVLMVGGWAEVSISYWSMLLPQATAGAALAVGMAWALRPVGSNPTLKRDAPKAARPLAPR
jgi:hypothetical protein